MTTIYDVFRHIIRGGPNTETNVQRMLDTIDSAERGYQSLEDWQAEQAKQAEVLSAGNRAASAVEQSASPDPRDAEIASLRAQLEAQRPAGAEPARA